MKRFLATAFARRPFRISSYAMFLIVIGILSLVLAFVRPLYPIITERSHVFALVGVATLVAPAAAFFFARRTLRLLELNPNDPGEGQFAFGRGMAVTQTLLAASHAALLLCTDWLTLCNRMPVVAGWPAVPGLLSFTPFLFSILLIWIAVYPADRAVRQIALEVYLFRSRPVHPVWSLGQFLAYNFRHQVLFILAPMLLILAARDALRWYEDDLQRLSTHANIVDLLLGTAAAAVAIIAPVILRYIWVTQRLPDGPLRDKLNSLCRKLRMRCREILIWHSGGMIVNAAVMGVVPQIRYVLLTDGMLEQLDDTKIEAVFGHEAGHVKRHHITFFLLFALISGCIVSIFSVRSRGLSMPSYQIAATILGALLAFKWGVLFFWISRRFERQADVFGVRTLAVAGVPCNAPCALHGAPGAAAPAAPQPHALCATAAHIFGDTLNDVAVLNGIPPEASSMRHGSIASRSRFVQSLAQNPAAVRRFERSVLLIKLAIFAAAVGMSFWAIIDMRLIELVTGLVNGAGGK